MDFPRMVYKTKEDCLVVNNRVEYEDMVKEGYAVHWDAEACKRKLESLGELKKVEGPVKEEIEEKKAPKFSLKKKAKKKAVKKKAK